ncbi:peptide ABC transporter ATP-binding protein, partial [Streptococcus gordonii]|nr:peptide ABC transporter ATP-binding protein [Streptococcus gordonii]
YDGQDLESLFRGFKDGSYSKARVYPRSSNYASVEKEYKVNIIFSPQGSSSFVVFTNIDRQSYNHTSKSTDAQKTSTNKAILNKDFRQALNFAYDRKAYSDQVNGEEGALKS